MRKITIDTFKAWQAGRIYKKSNSVWTDGVHIYSYNAHVLRVVSGDVFYNVKQYSATTSTHRNALRKLLVENGIAFKPYTPDNY